MKKNKLFLLLLICSLAGSVSATIHTIQAGSYYYNPASLTINVGDTVEWINDGGFHDVNADIDSQTGLSFNNPVSFQSSATNTVGAVIYTQIFTVQGTYNYDCSIGSHAAAGMTGVIIVNSLAFGCTDSLACNFDPLANTDDSSCVYSAPIFGSFGSTTASTPVVGDTVFYFIDAQTFVMPINAEIHFRIICDTNNIDTVIWDYNSVVNNTMLYDTDNNPNTNDVLSIVFPYVFNNTSCGCVWSNGNQLIYDQYRVWPLYVSYCDTINLTLGQTQQVALLSGPFYGCLDFLATNYDPLATCDNGMCTYPLPPAENLFFSEYAEGSSNNKYFEIYNPTSDTIDLTNYAFARVSNSPTTTGIYEYWVDFDSAAIILPNDVYVVVHPSSDSLLLAEADMDYGSLSNGDDGFALVYGNNPGSPMSPSNGGYQILDWIGDWNGDPGSGWDVAGVNNATQNHTLVRKCPISQGDTSWTNAAGTDPINSQWIVLANNDWTNIGFHNTCVCDSSTNSYTSITDTICNGLSIVVGNSIYDSTGVYSDTLLAFNGCDSIITTNLFVLSTSASNIINNVTICDGDSVVVGSNVYYIAGTYTDILVNSAGCDSIITTNLVVQTPTYQDITICDGDSIIVGNSVYNSTGSYTDTIQSSIGCDSIVHTNLIIYSQFNSIFGGIPNNTVGGGSFYSGQQSLELSCYMPSELVSAVIYSADTTLTTFEIRDNNGNVLDSVTANIIPGGHRIYFNYNMAAGSDYELGVNGGSNDLFRNNSGVSYPYNFGSLAAITSSSAGGNYYYFFYDIEVKQTSQPTNYSICDGDSISVAGNVYSTTGFYTDSLITSIGCDSLVFTNLVVYPNASLTNNQTICNGETYSVGSNIYDSTGIYSDTLSTAYGCDSIITTILIVDSISGGSSFNNQTICLGDSISVGTSTYYTSGTYSDTLTSLNGCDSVVTTSVYIFTVGGVNQQTICIGDSITVGNNSYYHSGVYSDTLATSNVCDSVVTTYLNVITANYNAISGGLLDTTSSPGEFSNYNGSLILDANVMSLLKSATVYSEDTNSVTFELRDNNGVVLQDITYTVYPGAQSLIFNFIIPVGTDFELGINGGNSGLYRNNAGSGNSIAYPFNIGSVNITSSNAGNQYYYFYYDIEIMPFGSYTEQFICEGDSVIVGTNVYHTPGIYLDAFLASNSCDSLVYTNLNFYQSPQLTIESVPNPPEICLGDTIILEASPGFVSYLWTDLTTVFGQSYILFDSPNDDQWYMVIAEDSNGCVSREDINVDVDTCATSINDELITNISVYPNPSSGIFTLELNNIIEKNTILTIVNSVGKVIWSEKLEIGDITKNINLSEYSKGIYFLEIETENRILNKKLVLK